MNGNKVLKRKIREVEQEYEPTTAEEKQDRRNEMKAIGTLLMALPNKDQLKFHSYKDAKLLMEAIEKMYGGSSSETMDQTFDRLQKLISQLEIQGETISQEDINLKLLRNLPSEWKTHALIWRNKVEIETISLDDLYNNLKIYELEFKDSTNTSQNSQNVAFVSSNSTNRNSSTNEANNTAYEVSSVHTQSIPTSGDNLSDAVICAFLATRKFIKRTECRLPRNQEKREKENNRRTVIVETPNENALVAQDGIGGYDWSYQAEEEDPTNFALMAHTSSGSSSSSDSELKTKRNWKKKKKEIDELKLTLEKFQNSSKSLNNLLESQVSDKFKTGLGYNAATAASRTVESFVNSSEMLENQEYNRSKGYHAVPPPYIWNFIPCKPDLTFINEIVKSENMNVTTVITPSDFEKDVSSHEPAGVKNIGDVVEPKTVRENNFIPPIIEDWNSDDKSEIDYTVRPSIEKIGFVKPPRETVEKVETPKQNKHYPMGTKETETILCPKG
ncbi:hypothetical protein Tco_0836471 [Tanacetum coccineum]